MFSEDDLLCFQWTGCYIFSLLTKAELSRAYGDSGDLYVFRGRPGDEGMSYWVSTYGDSGDLYVFFRGRPGDEGMMSCWVCAYGDSGDLYVFRGRTGDEGGVGCSLGLCLR